MFVGRLKQGGLRERKEHLAKDGGWSGGGGYSPGCSSGLLVDFVEFIGRLHKISKGIFCILWGKKSDNFMIIDIFETMKSVEYFTPMIMNCNSPPYCASIVASMCLDTLALRKILHCLPSLFFPLDAAIADGL